MIKFYEFLQLYFEYFSTSSNIVLFRLEYVYLKLCSFVKIELRTVCKYCTKKVIFTWINHPIVIWLLNIHLFLTLEALQYNYQIICIQKNIIVIFLIE